MNQMKTIQPNEIRAAASRLGLFRAPEWAPRPADAPRANPPGIAEIAPPPFRVESVLMYRVTTGSFTRLLTQQELASWRQAINENLRFGAGNVRDRIIQAVCEVFGRTESELKGPRGTAPVSDARQVAMFLFRTLTGESLDSIGRVFGDRDHGTVLHACRKVQGCIDMGDALGVRALALQSALNKPAAERAAA